MPVYEYKCDSCGHCLETIQKMSAKPLSLCPQCDAQALRRLMSAPAFQLRGTGWYETDFKNRQPPPRDAAADRKAAAPDADRADKSDKAGAAPGADKGSAAPGSGRPPGGQAGGGGDAARSGDNTARSASPDRHSP